MNKRPLNDVQVEILAIRLLKAELGPEMWWKVEPRKREEYRERVRVEHVS